MTETKNSTIKKTYWFVSYHKRVSDIFGSTFIEIRSDVFDYFKALSEIDEKKGISKWSTIILYFKEITKEEYELNKCW